MDPYRRFLPCLHPYCRGCIWRQMAHQWTHQATRALGRIARRGRRKDRRKRFHVQANELNKWGDRSGPEENAGLEDDGFVRDTVQIVTRALTARATQKVLMQLSETNLYAAQWLEGFCSEHRPLDGDKFLLELLRELPVTRVDKVNNAEHRVLPHDMAERIMETRCALAKDMGDLEKAVRASNLDTIKQHLVRNSYTSG